MSQYSAAGSETIKRFMSSITPVLTILIVLLVVEPSRAGDQTPLETVETVDLDRYLGRWYEIASYPAWFQRNCTAVTADYSLRDDGLIEVVNSCRKGSLDGKLKQSKGRAKVIDEITSRLSAKGYDPDGLNRTLQPDLGGEE